MGPVKVPGEVLVAEVSLIRVGNKVVGKNKWLRSNWKWQRLTTGWKEQFENDSVKKAEFMAFLKCVVEHPATRKSIDDDDVKGYLKLDQHSFLEYLDAALRRLRIIEAHSYYCEMVVLLTFPFASVDELAQVLSPFTQGEVNRKPTDPPPSRVNSTSVHAVQSYLRANLPLPTPAPIVNRGIATQAIMVARPLRVSLRAPMRHVPVRQLGRIGSMAR